jgi:hypothetical protein
MAADPAFLKRIRACSFARRSGEPLARLRLTGGGDDIVLLYPSHRGGWEPPGEFGALAMPLDLALERLSSNPYFLELRRTDSWAPPSPVPNRNAAPSNFSPAAKRRL